MSAIQVDLGLGGIDFDCPGVFSYGSFQVILDHQYVRAVVMKDRNLRIQLYGLVEIRKRRVEISFSAVCDAPGAVGLRGSGA